MFKNVSYKDISNKYILVKNKLKNVIKNNNIPKGSIVTWSANSDGIDLNSNVIYNIETIRNDKYLKLRYSNINYSHPGPINCPYNKESNFQMCTENKALCTFLDDLNNDNSLVAIFNYHSSGALIDQRPSEIPNNLKEISINILHKSIRNYLLSKFYQEETYKKIESKCDTHYKILKDKSEVRTLNGLFRVIYPIDFLIELSSIGGNPIGPYSDISGTYNNTIYSNINAFKKVLEVLEISNMYADEFYENLGTKDINDKEMMSIYEQLDSLYLKIKDTCW